MSKPKSVALLLCTFMLAGAATTVAITPSVKLADHALAIDLENLIPRRIGDWVLDDTLIPIAPDPEAQALLDKLYNQTLARSYADGAGNRIMLSIAYGGDQSDALQAHRPEVCYAGQGFEIVQNAREELLTSYGALPIRRLVALQGYRHEPITYWVTVGDKAAHAGWNQKLAQLAYGLSGRIPDGMLVRVSSIDRETSQAYRLQEDFINSLLASLPPQGRNRLMGRLEG